MRDILKQAQYALDKWNLSTGHRVLIESLVSEIEKLKKGNLPGIAHVSEIERLDDELEKAHDRIAYLEKPVTLTITRHQLLGKEVIQVETGNTATAWEEK